MTLTLAFLVFAFYLFFTPSGAQMAFELFSIFSPYKIECQKVKGTIISGLEMSHFSLNTQKWDIQAQHIKLDWEFKNLFQTEKTLQAIEASHLKIQLKSEISKKAINNPTMESLEEMMHHEIPFLFNVKQLQIQDANIILKNQTHVIQKLTIKGISSHFSKIESIQYQGEWGTIQANLTDFVDIKWNLNIKPFYDLSKYFSHNIITQGHVLMPTKKLDDIHNILEFHLHTKDFRFAQKSFKNIDFKVKGTIASHQIQLNSTYEKSPFSIVLKGMRKPYSWQGIIEKFKIDHPRWNKFSNSNGALCVNWKEPFTSIQLQYGNEFPIQIQAEIGKIKPYFLSGKIHSHVDNIGHLSNFFPDLINLRGKLDVNVNLSGSLLKPDFQGIVALKEGKIKTVSRGVSADLSELTATLDNGKINLHGEGSFGQGKFTLQGSGIIHGQSPLFEIHLQGENLLLSDTPEYRIMANPDLHYTLNEKGPSLTGKVFIPNAQIKSLKNPDRVLPSEDVVIVSKEKTKVKPLSKRKMITQLNTKIDLILGDNISYQGHGIHTTLSGKLRITQSPGETLNATGKLIFQNGKYRTYGKTFDIVYGQILFAGGPIYDPILDIRAQRKIQNLTAFSTIKNGQPIIAGIKFVGNIKSLNLEFYSKPSMPDSDIISYLIVGRPQSEIDQAQTELLFEAVSHLASMMGDPRKDVQFDLAERLKLDQIGFSKKANAFAKPGQNLLENTVLLLGKQLSDKLYLHYSLGLIDTASQLGLSYALSKNVTLEAVAGTNASSADVILSFEGH